MSTRKAGSLSVFGRSDSFCFTEKKSAKPEKIFHTFSSKFGEQHKEKSGREQRYVRLWITNEEAIVLHLFKCMGSDLETFEDSLCSMNGFVFFRSDDVITIKESFLVVSFLRYSGVEKNPTWTGWFGRDFFCETTKQRRSSFS